MLENEIEMTVPQDHGGALTKAGRAKGSKNKITLLKLMTEEAVRSKNLDRMLQVCDEIISDALSGDRDCRKLVWQAIMSKSNLEASPATGAVPEITIRLEQPAQLIPETPPIEVIPNE